MVSPDEEEFELLVGKIRDLVDDGRGETIIEVNSCNVLA